MEVVIGKNYGWWEIDGFQVVYLEQLNVKYKNKNKQVDLDYFDEWGIKYGLGRIGWVNEKIYL